MVTPGIDTLVRQLLAAFDPEEVILFGSRAYGTPRADSDADLLLVLRPTAEPARERMARAAVLASGAHVAADILPYTADEIRRYVARGNVAVRDALARGLVLYPAESRSRYAAFVGEWSGTATAEQWLGAAREDLELGETLAAALAGKPGPWRGAAFHAQQAAEKALKALIYHLGGEPDRTHRLNDLAVTAAGLDPEVGRRVLLRHGAKVGHLIPYAVAARYPEGPDVNEQQAREALEIAAALLSDVQLAMSERRGGDPVPQ